MGSRRPVELLIAAGVVLLVLFQLHMVHQHTNSANVPASFRGRLNGVWARYKERNFSIPNFLTGQQSRVRQSYIFNASEWLLSDFSFHSRESKRKVGLETNRSAANTTAGAVREKQVRLEKLRALERQVKNDIRLSAEAMPLFQKSSSITPVSAITGLRLGQSTNFSENSAPASAATLSGHYIHRGGMASNRASSIKENRGGTKRALIFTMDSLAATIEAAKRGGPAGEITIRNSLEAELKDGGFVLDVAGSDQEFARLSDAALAWRKRTGEHYYRLIIMDPWTWAEKSPPGTSTVVRARPLLHGRENATFILDFFGNKKLEHRDAQLVLPKSHVLTAFPRSHPHS